MQKFFSVLSMFVSGVFLSSQLALAQPMPRGFLPPDAIGELGLSSEVQDAVENIISNYEAEISEAMKAVQSAHAVLDALVRSGSSDEGAIRAAAGDLGAKIGDNAVVNAKIRGEIVSLLTEEQKQELVKIEARFEQHRHHRKPGRF